MNPESKRPPMSKDKDEPPMSMHEANARIQQIAGEIYIMGSNDYEMPTIRNILKALEKGDITPEKAVQQVLKIRQDKQGYH